MDKTEQLGRVCKSKPQDGGGDEPHGIMVLGLFLVTGGQAPELSQSIERALDVVTVLVECTVKRPTVTFIAGRELLAEQPRKERLLCLSRESHAWRADMTSEDSSRTTLLLYQIESPDWTQIDDRHRQRIVEPVVQGGWRWANGNRRGFLHCKEQGGVLYGYFAAEGSLDVEQYDENQQPVQEEQKSFERLLFLLFLNEGMLLVQSIRVYNFRDISGPLIRDSLLEELSAVFRDAGLAFEDLKLVRYHKTLSKEEMQQVFFVNDITSVEIDSLFGSRVPSHVRLFNPDFNADEFLRAVIDGDLKMSDKSAWEGEHLQKAKIVKGLVAAGNPKLVRGFDEHGELREWERSSPEDITLDLNTRATYFPNEDLTKLMDFIRLKLGLFRDRLADIRHRRETGVSDLPLFDDSAHT